MLDVVFYDKASVAAPAIAIAGETDGTVMTVSNRSEVTTTDSTRPQGWALAKQGLRQDWIAQSGVPREYYKHFYAVSEASRFAAEQFQPRPSDVIVATHSKSGTTMLQNLLEVGSLFGCCMQQSSPQLHTKPNAVATASFNVEIATVHQLFVWSGHRRFGRVGTWSLKKSLKSSLGLISALTSTSIHTASSGRGPDFSSLIRFVSRCLIQAPSLSLQVHCISTPQLTSTVSALWHQNWKTGSRFAQPWVQGGECCPRPSRYSSIILCILRGEGPPICSWQND